MTTEERVRELNSRAVEQLIEAHKKQTDEPLLLAIRYYGNDPLDVYLLEVLDGFPGGHEDELFVTEFEPSAQLRVLGKLHLALGSPEQLRAAIERKDPIIEQLREATVEFRGGNEAEHLLAELGL